MLNVFRRLEKTRSLIIIFFAVLLVIGLVVAGVYNRTGVAVANPFRNTEALAEVRGDEVTVADYSLRKQLLENQYSQFGGQISLAQLGLTGERLLNDAIDSRIAVQEAERLNLLPSDEEVRDQIKRDFTAAGGQFDFQRYKDYVTRNFGGVALFERNLRDQIAAQKLRAFVSAGAQVSAQEVQDKYARENTSFDLVYVPVTAQALAAKITPTDEELARYFDEHKGDYRFEVPQKKVRYVYVSQEKSGARLNISDEELRKEYDSLRPENKQAGVRVQQIVLKVARPELDQEVLARATQLVQRIRGEDTNATEEEFAEIARGNSEDTATAKNGGYLPAPVRRSPNRRPDQPAAPGNAAELLQNTLDWEEGFVGDPLKTGNAYYIFRRGAAVPKSFEDARQELLVSLRNRQAYGVAQQLARRAADLLKQSKDPQQVAQQLAGEANMSPAEMVRETPFVKPQDDVPEIGSSPDFEGAIQPLEEPGQVGEPVGVKGGFAIPMLVERRDPRVPELAEVRESVARDFREARAKEQLEQAARELAGASGPDALKAAAERLGLKAETEDAYRLGRPLGALGTDESLDAAVYALKPGEVTKSPVKVGDTYGVVAVAGRKDADPAEFEKQRAQLMESALEERRSQLFDEFRASVRRRLEQSGEIEIHRERLAALEAADQPPSALPRSPLNIPPMSDDTK